MPTREDHPPLCVDLDGTLLRGDALLESLFALLNENFFFIFLAPLWLLKGKAHFKQQIADRIDLDVSLLPYHATFLDFLKRERARGRKLVLATATHKKYAERIAQFLGIFDEVVASDADVNLSGARKGRRLLNAYGNRGFDYAGNSALDLEIWPNARKGILVNPESGIRKKAEALVEIEREFDDRPAGLQAYGKALRPHQWLKNLLVFVPLIMAHKAAEPALLVNASLAFLAFGLCASSVYLLNDLLDLRVDRQHPTKKKRPLAAGDVSIKQAVLLIPPLFAGSMGVALLVSLAFLKVLAFYYAVTLAYSIRLKQVVIIDVLALSGLYTLRLIAGAAAVGVPLSFWLLAFSMFLFLSLALVKRYSELLRQRQENDSTARGRGYWQMDLESLAQFGAASGYMSVLVLALYINSEQVKILYAHPERIWLLCPLILYWISRAWLLARRGEMDEDPVVFAIRDRRSYGIGLIGLIILWVAI